jgi:hypothetical protein
MEVSGHSHASAALTLCRESCYTLSMRLCGFGASLQVLNKRKIACNYQGLKIIIIQSAAQSLNCNIFGSLKFLYPFRSSPMRVTRHANRNLLELFIVRPQASRTSYEAPHSADCSIVFLSIPPSYYQILFLHLLLKTFNLNMYILTYQPSDLDSGIQNFKITVTFLMFISSYHGDKLNVSR